MRINWGTGITITFSLFAAGMLSLVMLCVQQPQDLVSVDYYNREIAFQQQINKTSNTLELLQPLQFNYDAATHSVIILFPPEMKGKSLSGALQFFKPDNAALDFEIPVHPDQSLGQLVDAGKMKNGLWHIKADWKSDENSFYQEASIVIK